MAHDPISHIIMGHGHVKYALLTASTWCGCAHDHHPEREVGGTSLSMAPGRALCTWHLGADAGGVAGYGASSLVRDARSRSRITRSTISMAKRASGSPNWSPKVRSSCRIRYRTVCG
jgi:hypothetical protein